MDFVKGFMEGLLIVLFIVAIIIFATIKKKKGGCKNEYDERQLIERGKAYRAAFFTLMIASFGIGLFAEVIKEYVSLSFLVIIAIFISLVVYAEVCIFKDAYVGINTNLKKTVLLVGGIAIMNLGIGINNIINIYNVRNGGHFSITDDNWVQGPLNIALAILLFVVVISLLIKNALDKKEA